MELHYENRIVAFIDILGFKELVRQSELDPEKLKFIYQALNYLKKRETPQKWGIKLIEIEEDAQKKGVHKFDIEQVTRCTCFSDSIIVSAEYDGININEVVSTFIANIARMGSFLLTKGILLRGGVTCGKLIHSDDGVVVGQALIDAYQIESNSAKYPRILLSNKLIKELNYPLNTKKNRYPYHQYLCRFEDGCVGFHQMISFQVLQNSSVLDDVNLKKKLDAVRKVIIAGLDSTFERSDIYAKYLWLKNAYNELCILDVEKERLYDLNENLPEGNIHFSYSNEYPRKKRKKS